MQGKTPLIPLCCNFGPVFVYGFIGHNTALTSSPLRQNQMHVDCMNVM